jgi:2-dehydro-3-deoxy-D-arabinonate dehydratase
MRLGQIAWNHAINAAIFDDHGTRPIPDHSFYDLIRRSEKERIPLASLARSLATAKHEQAAPLIPIHPQEVWGLGCTYESSSAFRDAEHGTREGFYAHIYREPRPGIFFKGNARTCVGPEQPIGLRPDSKFTAPEAELAVVLGSSGAILGYTLANDVSAWDMERENPLYLAQSKIYAASCAIGPVIVTPDEIPDPYQVEISCTITRCEANIFSGQASTASLHRKIDQMIEYVCRSNPVPCGSVLLTGTGIVVGEDAALAPGDTVTIHAAPIGRLSNIAALV